MRHSVFIFTLFLSGSLMGQMNFYEKATNAFVDSLFNRGIDSVLIIQIGSEGGIPSDSDNTWSQYILWPDKNRYLVKKWTPTKQFKEEQVFVPHLYSYIKAYSSRLNQEKFKSCVDSDHYRFSVVRLRVKHETHTFKKYSYQFSDSCPEENEYNNKLLLKKMFDLFESEIKYINKKIIWTL